MIFYRHFHSYLGITTSTLAILAGGLLQAYPFNPDLRQPNEIANLKSYNLKDAAHLYGEDYNLGPTGLRGWIYIDGADKGGEGLQTDKSRQILVTAVGSDTPAEGILLVDDVILGVTTTSNIEVPLFTNDCRKTFGLAIGEAEKNGTGKLYIKRWRNNVENVVSITLAQMGSYTDTTPYNCTKTNAILKKAIVILEQETFNTDWSGAIQALALLSAVDLKLPANTAIKTKLANYAHALAPTNLSLTGCKTWDWGYENLFLCEYYLRTREDNITDISVLHGIQEYTVNLAKSQSMYGTFSSVGAEEHADGSLHGSISWYGPINSAGLVANISILLGKKSLTAGGIILDSNATNEVNNAIDRGSKFFKYYVNKGAIPYGEHEPFQGGHASNGKDPMAAILFGLQDNQKDAAQYYARMSISGYIGREYGHTGQGFSYLWAALGAGMGGNAASTAHLSKVLWHLDLERRTDGSFVYDGSEQYGGGSTEKHTYLGKSGYNGLSPTACYVLTYAMSQKRLLITGRNPKTDYTLSAQAVTDSLNAATYKQRCYNFNPATLILGLENYDPVVRHAAASELAKRSLIASEETTLINLISDATLSSNINLRQGVSETLGLRREKGTLNTSNTESSLTALSQRLKDTDFWVRGKAANALRQYSSAASPQLYPMINAFIASANATTPGVINWDDPIQFANSYLADTLFKALATQTYKVDKNLLYSVLNAGLKQPSGLARDHLSSFIKNLLSLEDVKAIAPNLIEAIANRSPADTMNSENIRNSGLELLAKYKIEEGIPLCLMLKEQTWHTDAVLPFEILRNTYGTSAKEVLPTLYAWRAKLPVFKLDGAINSCCPGRYDRYETNINSTIAALEGSATPPVLNYLKTVNISKITRLALNKIQLNAISTDSDGGIPRFVWSMASGPGLVTFSSNGSTASASTTATFSIPGTYVLRVSVADSSIMNAVTWWKPHRLLGYYDFQTFDRNYGTIYKDSTVVSLETSNSPPDRPSGLITALGDSSVSLSWDTSFGAASYKVKRASVSGGPYATLINTKVNNYRDTTAVNNKTYFYVVSALNNYGKSINSEEVRITTDYMSLPVYVNLDSASVSGLTGPGGGFGATWNQSSNLSSSSLLNSAGMISTISFECSAGYNGSWGTPTLSMLRGGAFNWAANSTYNLTISGLNKDKKYHLFLASFYPSEDGSRALFSTTNSCSTISPQIVDNQGPNGNSSSWVAGVNYARFQSIMPNATGQIVLSITGEDTISNQRRAYLSGFQLIETSAIASPYGTWSSNTAQRLSAGINDSAMDDPDADGASNLLEFVLNGNPQIPSSAILPSVVTTADSITFAYDRSTASLPPATTQIVEYGSDLTNWTAVTIPATSLGMVTITPGATSDHVSVVIPNSGTMMFVRLRVSK